MELTHDDVLEILGLLEGSDVEYLELEVGGTRIVADRNGTRQHTTTVPNGDAEAGPRHPASPPRPALEEPPSPVTAPGARVSGQPSLPEPTLPDGDVVTVTAPVVGVFYRAPEPGAAPFTEVGARVSEDSTVGLVEVMKMYNSVTAGVCGRVVEILAGNDSFVEYGQPLMRIEPERSA